MPESENDVCGVPPFEFKGWARDACYWHDLAYRKGSWHQENLSRKSIDKKFLEHLRLLAGANEARLMQAEAMYFIVRLIGGMFWEGRK